MQGQRSAVDSLSELSDSGIDPQRCWTDLRNPSQDQLSDCVISASNATVAYLNGPGHEGHSLSGWNFGESSSAAAQNQVNQTGRVRLYGSPDILSLNNAEMNTDQIANGRLFMQTASIPQDHYSGLEYTGHNDDDDDDDDDDEDDDDCRVIECAGAYKSGLSNERFLGSSSSSEPRGMPSGNGGYIVEESDSRRLSCKRKTIEGNVGQSSGSGILNHLHNGGNGFWHAAAAPHLNPSINLPEQVHPRLGLSIGEVPLTLSDSGIAENSSRNFRLRINNASLQQDYMPSNVSLTTESVGGSSNGLSAHRPLRLQPGNNSLDAGPISLANNGSSQRPTVVEHVPLRRQNPVTRWYRASSSGASSSNSAFTRERDAPMYEAPITRSVPRNLSEHPMFLPPVEMGSSSQSSVNWSLAAGNISNPGHVAPLSRTSSSSGVNSSVPSLLPDRSSSQNPRRLSEFVRRSMLSSTGTDPPVHSATGSSLREIVPLPSGSGHHHGHHRYSRSVLLERHHGNALGYPYSTRTLAAASEGRHRIVSEQIRNVLDLMRRGEGLRFEDVMILDQSVFLGMADIDDRHRDMRLDVDNMSYEELLALEERIGDVCTGLNDETITSKLKQRKYAYIKTEGQGEVEPCCVCQEEYNTGEDLGTLECGHDFHANCIKQWLKQKNLCPICKTTGLSK